MGSKWSRHGIGPPFSHYDASPAELLAAIREVSQGKFAVSTEVKRQIAVAGGFNLVRDLTSREIDVLELLALPYTVAQVAVRLNISRKTVYTHLAHIQAKLGESTPEGAVRRAQELHLIDGGAGS